MSTATPPAPASDEKTTAPSYALPGLGGEAHFLFRRLHSLTGLVFGGYVIVHLLVNATLLEANRYPGEATVFQMQVDKIHSTPWLVAVEWTAIILPLIYHTIYGLWITFTGQPNPQKYGYTKNWLYTAQRVSALILILFIAFHVLGMKGWLANALSFVPVGLATESTGAHLQASFLIGWVIYPIGILAATFHLANGFWAAAVTWGLTITKSAQKKWGIACIGIFLFSTACGFAALIGGLTVDVPREGRAGEILAEAQEEPHLYEHKGVLPVGTDAVRD